MCAQRSWKKVYTDSCIGAAAPCLRIYIYIKDKNKKEKNKYMNHRKLDASSRGHRLNCSLNAIWNLLIAPPKVLRVITLFTNTRPSHLLGLTVKLNWSSREKFCFHQILYFLRTLFAIEKYLYIIFYIYIYIYCLLFPQLPRFL